MAQSAVLVNRVESLARLLQSRNQIDEQTAHLICRPALPGHIGEWLASEIFGVQLHASANQCGSDGKFTAGPLAGRSVNVKFYGKREGILDLKKPDEHQPDFYLVITGPRGAAASSRGSSLPCLIAEVFLFEAAPLLSRLTQRGVRKRGFRIGVATSVTLQEWENARIYPVPGKDAMIQLQPDQIQALALFNFA